MPSGGFGFRTMNFLSKNPHINFGWLEIDLVFIVQLVYYF